MPTLYCWNKKGVRATYKFPYTGAGKARAYKELRKHKRLGYKCRLVMKKY